MARTSHSALVMWPSLLLVLTLLACAPPFSCAQSHRQHAQYSSLYHGSTHGSHPNHQPQARDPHFENHRLGRQLLQLRPGGTELLASVPSGSTAGGDSEPLANRTVLLATERTRRVNPRNNFKYYVGGWNLTSDDYWASMTWSVIYAPVVGLGWILLGIGFSLFLLCLYLFCRNRWEQMRDPGAHVYTPQQLHFVLFAMACGTIIVLAGFGLMVAGSRQLSGRIVEIASYSVGAVNATTNVVYGAATAIQVTAATRINGELMPPEERLTLFDFSRKVTAIAVELNEGVSDSDQELRRFVHDVSVVVYFFGCINVVVILMAVVVALIQWVTLSNILVAFLWLLSFATWCTVALFLIVVIATSDTSAAMRQVIASPSTPTSMHAWVPCVGEDPVVNAARYARYTARAAIGFVNETVWRNYPQVFPHLNSSGLCSPFGPGPDYTFNEAACGRRDVDFKAFVEVLLPTVTCSSSSSNQQCPTTSTRASASTSSSSPRALAPIPPSVAADISLAYSAVERLDGTAPPLMALLTCGYVASVAAFISRTILGLQRAAALLWSGTMVVAVGGMVVAVAVPVYVFRAMRCLAEGEDGVESGFYKSGDYSATPALLPIATYTASAAAAASHGYNPTISNPYTAATAANSQQPQYPPPPPLPLSSLHPSNNDNNNNNNNVSSSLQEDSSVRESSIVSESDRDDEPITASHLSQAQSSYKAINYNSNTRLTSAAASSAAPSGVASSSRATPTVPSRAIGGGALGSGDGRGGNTYSNNNPPTGFGASGYGSSYDSYNR